jgi:YidC/Oxa1 family membrane protein insertase
VENQSQKRTAVAFGLIFLLTAVYMTWFAPSPTPPHTAGAVDAGTVATTTPTPAPAPVMPALPAAPPTSAGTPPTGPAVRTLEVSRKLVHYVFSTEGAGLISAKLLGERTRDQRSLTMAEGWAQLLGKDIPRGPQMDLARPVPGAAQPLSMELAGESPIPATLRYSAEQGDHRITFVGRTDSWEVTKEVSWVDDGYELSTRVTLRNLTGRPLSGELVLPYGRAIDPAHEEKPSFFGGVGNVSDAACFVKDTYEHETVKDTLETKEHAGLVRWTGINQQYFLSAIFPVGTAVEGKCVLTTSLSERIATARFPVQVGPGQSVTRAFGAFLGPKDTRTLADVPELPANRATDGPNTPVHLERAVDYGIWAALCKPMLLVLKWFHGIVRNWGVAIILLTVLVKVLLIPLTHRAMVGQEAMKKLQPKIEEVKKKFPEDKERQQMEMMKAYQEAGVNPFGSCLMILVQLPVWAALFTTLRNSYELYGEPFTLHFVTDLTIKDPTYLLPVLLGVSQIITSKLQPPALDPAQQRMMVWFMPIFFTVIMLQYPAGLLLYIFTNNLLTVVQQAVLKRMVGSTPTPPLKAALEKRK